MVSEETLFSVDEFERAYRRLTVGRHARSMDEAREFYGWTQHKLDILGIYLRLYRRVAGNGSYIDGFAGTGEISVDGIVREGSVGVALKSGAFKRMRLYEKPAKARSLQEWVSSHAKPTQLAGIAVIGGDFNKKVRADLDAEVVPKDKPCFAFLDPDSTQLDWTTVETLARYKAECSPPETCKIELWILLNTYQALMRLMPINGKVVHEKTLNRWLGGEAGWRDLYEQGQGAPFFARRYAKRLESEFGYGAANVMTIRDPKNGRPQYHMIHASDHHAAHSFMRWSATHAHPEDSIALPLPGLA